MGWHSSRGWIQTFNQEKRLDSRASIFYVLFNSWFNIIFNHTLSHDEKYHLLPINAGADIVQCYFRCWCLCGGGGSAFMWEKTPWICCWTPGRCPQKNQRMCHGSHSIPQFEKAIVVGKNKHSFLKRTIQLIITKSNKSNCNPNRNEGWDKIS